MKKALIPILLLCMSVLAGCSSASEEAQDAQPLEEASFSLKEFAKPGKQEELHDVTAFLVGEYYVSNGASAFFDGRGSATIVFPDGNTLFSQYILEEGANKSATLTADLGDGEKRYAYELISSDGGFTLTDSDSSLLVFVLKTYE